MVWVNKIKLVQFIKGSKFFNRVLVKALGKNNAMKNISDGLLSPLL